MERNEPGQKRSKCKKEIKREKKEQCMGNGGMERKDEKSKKGRQRRWRVEREIVEKV